MAEPEKTLRVNITNVLSKLSPSELQFAGLLQTIRRQFGKPGLKVAQGLGLSAKLIESDDFDREDFLNQVAEAMQGDEDEVTVARSILDDIIEETESEDWDKDKPQGKPAAPESSKYN